ncbi:MAG: hypothetical protein Q3965_04600 [Rothia sp. (in: high G+C Gram-positive bacteria)]|nr:hypothetical protein [Rothia sp. (in: high G+C Gram-positive bacteria)]
MNTEETQAMRTSRRNIMRFAAITGAVSAASATGALMVNARQAHAADAISTVFPPEFAYPAVTGPALALWGSSSIEGVNADQGVPAGVNAKLDVLLGSYLKAPVLNFGRGGETSTQILARRGSSQSMYKLIFPDDTVPASGSVEVSLAESSRIDFNTSSYVPGFIGDTPGTLVPTLTTGIYLFTRMVPGDPIYAPANTPASRFYSYQEMISRACYHLIQMGRNNLEETDKIRKDTQYAFESAPERTLVMGHFPSRGDSKDSDRAKSVRAYNSWAAEKYGALFLNPETYLRETTQENWLRYGALAGSGVWASDTDQKARAEGKIPPSLFSSDGLHLNGWGYTALAQMVYYKLTELGWF